MERTRKPPYQFLLIVFFGFLFFLLAAMKMVKEAAGQELSGKTVSVVMFTATWCPNCPGQKAVCEAVKRSQNVELLTVDIDKEPQLQAKWGVNRTVPTTFVVTKDGNNLSINTKVVGISTQAKMEGYIKEARRGP